MKCFRQLLSIVVVAFVIAQSLQTNIVVGQWAKTGRPVERIDRWLGVGNGAGYHWRSPGPNIEYYQPWSHLNSSAASFNSYRGCNDHRATPGIGPSGNTAWYPEGPLDSNWGYPVPPVYPQPSLPLPPTGQDFLPMPQPRPSSQETTYQPQFQNEPIEIRSPNVAPRSMPRFVSSHPSNAPRSIWSQSPDLTSTSTSSNEPTIAGPQVPSSNRSQQAEQWMQSLERQRRVYQR